MAVAAGEEHTKPLRESERNLSQLANHIDTLQPDKNAAQQAEQYTVDALASVAFQVFTASQALVSRSRESGNEGGERERERE